MKKTFSFLFLLLAFVGLLFSEEAEPSLNIRGYGQVQLSTYSGATGFSIPNAVVDLKSFLAKNLEFKLELNAVAGSNAPSYSSVQECYLDWNPSKKFGLRIGKQFMYYTQAKDPSEWELIEYPLSTSLATIYDVGIVAYGNPFKFLTWRVGVVNGSESLSDFSGKKHLFWGLEIKPVSWFSFGASSLSNRGYYEFTPNNGNDYSYHYGLDTELAQNKGLFGDNTPGRYYFGRSRVSAHLALEGETITGLGSYFLIEYLSEEDENTEGLGGLYMLYTQYITKKIQLALLSENYDCGLDDEKIYVSNALSINYFPEKNIKLQASYVWIRDYHDRFLAQLQFSF